MAANPSKRRRLSIQDVEDHRAGQYPPRIPPQLTPWDSFQGNELDPSFILPPSQDERIQSPNRSHALQLDGTQVLEDQDCQSLMSFDEFDSIDIDKEFAAFEGEMSSHTEAADDDNASEYFGSEEFDDDAMAELLDTIAVQEPHHPPSSVVRAHDHDSRSADEFDTDLQYSPPRPSSTLSATSRDDQSLQQEVDWEPVLRHASKYHADWSQRPSSQSRMVQPPDKQGTRGTAGSNPQASTLWTQIQTPASIGVAMLLKPHKTFFHVKEMLDAKQQMFMAQPDATFEMFARVVYSSRENFHHKQYFQFRDLFKEAPPYLTGALLG